MTKEKIVVLNSGGLNSAVATAIVKHDHPLALLHVRFGDRAADREAEFFGKQAEFFEAEQQLVVDMPHFETIGGNARVNRKLQIEDALAIGEGRSSSHVPGLIGSLLHAGFAWARVIGASKLCLGVSEDLGPPGPQTSRVYPDYSYEYIDLCGHALRTASPDRPVSIETPLIDLSRSEIVKLGQRLHVPFEWTWSCLSSPDEPCGACLGCATRNRGFLDSTLADPILGDLVSNSI